MGGALDGAWYPHVPWCRVILHGGWRGGGGGGRREGKGWLYMVIQVFNQNIMHALRLLVAIHSTRGAKTSLAGCRQAGGSVCLTPKGDTVFKALLLKPRLSRFPSAFPNNMNQQYESMHGQPFWICKFLLSART